MQAFEVALDHKQDLLQQLLAKETGRCLVFARTKRGTERLANNLTRQGFAAAMIHGNRSQSQRTAALTGFQKGRYRVLVATDVASRGIHVQEIVHVINYDMPEIADVGRELDGLLAGLITLLGGEIPAQLAPAMR